MTKLFKIGLLFMLGALVASAAPKDEIEALLHFVGTMEGASFVRNGDVHLPKEAENHLRMKWEKQEANIKTAEDFIRLCASRSVVSGKAYVIRYQDGHEVESAVVLLKQLEAIRKQTPAAAGH